MKDMNSERAAYYTLVLSLTSSITGKTSESRFILRKINIFVKLIISENHIRKPEKVDKAEECRLF